MELSFLVSGHAKKFKELSSIPCSLCSGGASAGAAGDPWEARASCKTYNNVLLLNATDSFGRGLSLVPFSASR